MDNSANNLDYSIGVVTYVSRLKEFFIPIVKQLAAIFPDKEIVCIINGHPDASLQIDYLKHVTAFLAGYPNVRYLTYERHQPLAKCFNWLLMMSFAPRMLILNDDVSLNLLFRKDFEKGLERFPDFFVVNRSWSHFVISKALVKRVGWFEERLAGTGQEDGDYRIRMEKEGIPISEATCYGVINYVAPQKNAGWQNISEVSKNSGKASEINDQFIGKKYTRSGANKDGSPIFVMNQGMETPVFYEPDVLDNLQRFPHPDWKFKGQKTNPLLNILLPLQWTYSFVRKTGGKIYRFLKAKV